MPGDQLYPSGSDAFIRLGDPFNPKGPGGLRNLKTGAWINNATVIVEKIVDRSTGEEVPASGTLDYVSETNGVYIGELSSTVPIAHGQKVKIWLRATEPGGGLSRFYIDAVGHAAPRPLLLS